MATFHLQIVDLDGLVFDGQAQQVSCRTIHGDLAILARHINYVTAIAVGKAAVVFEDGSRREAACVGGMLSMMDGECRLIANTWEWQKGKGESSGQTGESGAERKDKSCRAA